MYADSGGLTPALRVRPVRTRGLHCRVVWMPEALGHGAPTPQILAVLAGEPPCVA